MEKRIIQIGLYLIELEERPWVSKKYNMVEIGLDHWKLGFTEIRKFSKFRWFIKHDIKDNWTVCHNEDLELFINYFLKLS